MSKRLARPPRWLVQARELGGYGLWEATVTREDGRRFTGGGLSRGVAVYRAQRKAEEGRT